MYRVCAQGQDCEEPIHACISNPCKNGGTCHLKDGDENTHWWGSSLKLRTHLNSSSCAYVCETDRGIVFYFNGFISLLHCARLLSKVVEWLWFGTLSKCSDYRVCVPAAPVMNILYGQSVHLIYLNQTKVSETDLSSLMHLISQSVSLWTYAADRRACVCVYGELMFSCMVILINANESFVMVNEKSFIWKCLLYMIIRY